MPTVVTEDGYQVVIYPNDHPPAHVHVRRAEKDARVQLDPVAVMSNSGFTSRELRRIQAIIREHLPLLLSVWDEYHESR